MKVPQNQSEIENSDLQEKMEVATEQRWNVEELNLGIDRSYQNWDSTQISEKYWRYWKKKYSQDKQSQIWR